MILSGQGRVSAIEILVGYSQLVVVYATYNSVSIINISDFLHIGVGRINLS